MSSEMKSLDDQGCSDPGFVAGRVAIIRTPMSVSSICNATGCDVRYTK